jgi:hypothetical protein
MEAEAPLLALRRLADGRTQWDFVNAHLNHDNFAVRLLTGRGYGVVATRLIRRGERIVCEAPLLSWEQKRDFAQLEQLVDALDKDSWRDFFGLADIHATGGRGKTAAGVWNTNSFVTQDVLADGLAESIDGIRRTALFRLCSRFNHACHPSCFVAWSGTIRMQTVHALRDITVGEELTIAYVAGAEAGARASRRALLARKYRFVCQCATCMLGGSELEQSDARHERLVAIHKALNSEGLGNGNLATLVEEQMHLMQAEGVPLILGKAGWILALLELRSAGKLDAARAWATRGVEVARSALGDDSSAYQRFVTLKATLDAEWQSATLLNAASVERSRQTKWHKRGMK